MLPCQNFWGVLDNGVKLFFVYVSKYKVVKDFTFSSTTLYCSKASPNHYTSTSMLHCWDEVLFLDCCMWFLPNISYAPVSKYSKFRLICPKKTIPEKLPVVYVLSGKSYSGLHAFTLRGKVSFSKFNLQAVSFWSHWHPLLSVARACCCQVAREAARVSCFECPLLADCFSNTRMPDFTILETLKKPLWNS